MWTQVEPPAGDTLNFTNVLFSFPWQEGAESFEVEVEAQGNRTVTFKYGFHANRQIINGLTFGTAYRWRYSGFDASGNRMGWSEYFPFVIGNSPRVDTASYHYEGRRRKRGEGEPGVILFDYGRIATNRAGVPQFFLPEFPFLRENSLVRDLKMTWRGTLTALLDSTACEMDLRGNIIWQAPDDGKISGEAREGYHHNLTLLENGNYLVLGTDHAPRNDPEGNPLEAEFGTIIEYDPSGNVVWSWNSKDYFSDKDLFCRKGRDGRYDVMTHLNAVTTDGELVYAGFRDISRVVTIDRKTKKVIASYGGYGYPAELHSATGFFRRQHDATRLSDGNFAVVNNDSVMDPDVVSSLVIFSPISREHPKSEKIFEFRFDFDTLTNGKSVKTGNLQEMRNGNILVNMGAIPRCVEVTRKGELIWDLRIERYDTNHRMWLPFPQYRVNFASSLYPYECTARVISDRKTDKGRIIRVQLWNVGSEADDYTLRLQSPKDKGGIVHKSRIVNLKPEESNELEFQVNDTGPLEMNISGHHCRYSLVLHVTGN